MTSLISEYGALIAIVVIPTVGALFALVMPGEDRLALRYVGLGASIGTAVAVLVRLLDALHEPIDASVLGLRVSVDALSLPVLASVVIAVPIALRSGAPRIVGRTQFYVVTVLFAEALMIAAIIIDAVFVRLAIAALASVPFFALVALFGGPVRGSTTMRAVMIWLLVDTLAIAILAWLAARSNVDATSITADDVRSAIAGLSPAAQSWVFVALAAPGLVRLAAGPFSLWWASFFEEAPVSAAILSVAGAAPLGAILLVKLAVFVGAPGMVPLLRWIAIIGAISALLSGLIVVAERDVRRLLAQLVQASSVASALALLVLDERALAVGLVHSVAAGASAGLALAAIEAVERRAETRDIVELAGLAQANPLLAFTMLVGFAALAGVPAMGAGTTLWLVAGALARADSFAAAGMAPLSSVWLAVAVCAAALLAVVGVTSAARRFLQPAPKRRAQHIVAVLTFGQALRLVIPACLVFAVGVGAERLVAGGQAAARAPVRAARVAAGLSPSPHSSSATSEDSTAPTDVDDGKAP